MKGNAGEEDPGNPDWTSEKGGANMTPHAEEKKKSGLG